MVKTKAILTLTSTLTNLNFLLRLKSILLQREFEAADNFGASGCPRNTTPLRSAQGQTVLLTAGPRGKLQNSHFFPKFSEAVRNPKNN